MTKQELQDMIAAYDIVLFRLKWIKHKPTGVLVACSKLATRIAKDQKELMRRFNRRERISLRFKIQQSDKMDETK